MSKGSGGTRSSYPGKSVQSEGFSESSYQHILDTISEDGEWTNADMALWESMTNDQRYLALMESGFTGLTADDDIDIGNLYYAQDKKSLITILAEQMANEATGYGAAEDLYFTIGYKDGSYKDYGGNGNDYDLSKITNNQSWKTQQEVVNSIIKTGQISFILYSDAWSQPRYYAKNKAGLDQLKKYGGFEEWKKGRGEKKRDYIQDDWV